MGRTGRSRISTGFVTCFVAALCVIATAAGDAGAQWSLQLERAWRSDVGRADLEHFVNQCELIAEQIEEAEVLYAAHRRRFDEFVDEYRGQRDELTEQIESLDAEHDFSTTETPWPLREKFNRLLVKRDLNGLEAVEKQRQLDARVLREFRSLLDDEQREACWRTFETWRLRRQVLTRTAGLADGRLDLIDMVESLEIDVDAVIDHRGRRPLRLLLDEYEHDLHRAMVQYRDAVRDVMIRATKKQVRDRMLRYGIDDLGEVPDDPYAGERTMQAELAASTPHHRRIARLNRRYHRDISAWIPEDALDDYMADYRKRRGGTFYTGQMVVYDEVVKRIEASDDLTDRQQRSIEALRTEYAARRHRDIDRAVDLRDSWIEARMSGDPDRNRRREEHHESVQKLYRSQARGIERLLDALTETQRARLDLPSYPRPERQDPPSDN